MTVEKELSYYEDISRNIRRTILEIIHRTKSPHIGSSFSIVEVLVALYYKHLNLSPDNPSYSDRDRFILSKGHACPALYAILAERGFLDKKELAGFAVDGGILEQHPNLDLSHGIEVSTGSLGHGLSIGTGMALAAKTNDKQYKVYVLLGDGELNEGSVWEAIMFASHHGLNNLVALVDYNKMQALGHTTGIINLDPLVEKWRAFGWHAQEINGHDFEQVFNSLASLSIDKPNVIILNTVKGKGVCFMEDQLLWHYRAPDEKEYELALKELA